jgi:hypothetical protein
MQQLLRGRGDVHLNIGATATAAAAAADGIGAAATAAAAAGFGFLPSSWQRQFEPRKRRHSWGFSAGLGRYASQVQGSSQAVAAASMLAAGGVAAACVPLGLQLAAALTADPSNSGHVVVPMVLVGESAAVS